MVVATTASEELRHSSVSGTLGWSELARVPEAARGRFDLLIAAVSQLRTESCKCLWSQQGESVPEPPGIDRLAQRELL